MTARAPIPGRIPNLRQRRRANGAWRVWWEPSATARAAGFTPVELDPARPTWSVRQAKKLNDQLRLGLSGRAPTGGRTIADLVAAYTRDPEYLDKRPKTRLSYDANMRLILRKLGAQNALQFSKPIMREWYLTLAKSAGPTQAQALIRMMSILFSFAELKGWREEGTNPCFRLKMKAPRPRPRCATWAELDAICDAATLLKLPATATAALMSALQGQRQTDVLAATAADFLRVTLPVEGGHQQEVWAWRVDRSKRDTLGLMQLHPLVLERIEPLLAEGEDGALLRDDRTGKPFDTYLFQKRWGAVRTEAAKTCPSLAGSDPLQFRDLRRTFAVWARAAGASDDDVGDVLGNTAALDPRLQETYMPASFTTASRAVLSIQRPTPSERKKA